MHIPNKLRTNRAFIKKALNFIKYYPLTRKNPGEMLRDTLKQLEDFVSSAENIGELECLSREAEAMISHPCPKELFQIQVIGERDRFIIYRPCKFFNPDEGDDKIADIYDLLYIPPIE